MLRGDRDALAVRGRAQVVPGDDRLHARVALAHLADGARAERVAGQADAVGVDVAARGVVVGEEEAERVLGALVEVVALLERDAGALARAVVAGEVRVALALDVVGHRDVAVRGEVLGGPEVEVLVALDRAVGDHDARVAAGRLRDARGRLEDVAAQGRAVLRRERHARDGAEAGALPARDRAERVGGARARDERRDAAARVRRVLRLLGERLEVEARELRVLGVAEGGARELVAVAQARAEHVAAVALVPLGAAGLGIARRRVAVLVRERDRRELGRGRGRQGNCERETEQEVNAHGPVNAMRSSFLRNPGA